MVQPITVTPSMRVPAVCNGKCRIEPSGLRFWAASIPVVDPPNASPKTFPQFPPIGEIGILNAPGTAEGKIACWDFDTAVIGPRVTSREASIMELQELLPELRSGLLEQE